jgi:hypothetical protein
VGGQTVQQTGNGLEVVPLYDDRGYMYGLTLTPVQKTSTYDATSKAKQE